MSGGSSAPTRVLLATAAGERGGAEVTLESLAGCLDRRRYAPVLAAPEGSPLLDAWRRTGFEVAGTYPVGRLRDPLAFRAAVSRAADVIRECAIDLVHTHGVAAQWHVGHAARRRRRPVVSHVQDMFDPSWTRNGLLHRLATRTPRAFTIACSAAVAASLRGRVPADRCAVIPNPVHTALVQPVARPAHGPLIVWCGRLQRWKGCHLFLDAARHVLDARRDARFAVVGGTVFGLDRDYPDQLRRQVDALRMHDAVEFVGHVPDARPWFRAGDLFVHSSVTPEPFGLVMAEAMIQERPVAAFAHGGASEIVVDGVTGRLVAPGDTRALAAAVLELLNDDERRIRMGTHARERALQLYAAESVTQRVAAIYDLVLADTRESKPAGA